MSNNQVVDEGDVSFGDDRVKTKSFDPNKKAARFDPEVGVAYLISFFKDSAVKRNRHYGLVTAAGSELLSKKAEDKASASGREVKKPQKQSNKPWRKYLRCLQGTSGFCPACLTDIDKGLKSIKEVFGENIFVWKTNENGLLLNKSNEVIMDESGVIFEGHEGEATGGAAFWAFGTDKFVQLRTIKKMNGGSLVGLMIRVEGIDSQFKKVTMQAYPRTVGPMASGSDVVDYYTELLADAVEEDGIKNVADFLCQTVTAEEMCVIYGLEDHLRASAQKSEFLHTSTHQKKKTKSDVKVREPETQEDSTQQEDTDNNEDWSDPKLVEAHKQRESERAAEPEKNDAIKKATLFDEL